MLVRLSGDCVARFASFMAHNCEDTDANELAAISVFVNVPLNQDIGLTSPPIEAGGFSEAFLT